MSEEISRGPRRAAAALTAVQALALFGCALFYLYELAVGEGGDPVRVVMSAVLIALFGVALGVLARAWSGVRAWPRTPTIVWSALLFPVGGTIVQGGLAVLGWGVILLALATALVAVGSNGVSDVGPEAEQP